jgi:hypothetical protein
MNSVGVSDLAPSAGARPVRAHSSVRAGWKHGGGGGRGRGGQLAVPVASEVVGEVGSGVGK